MTSGTGSGLVSRNKEGTQIILAQFPPSGSTLSAFGLTPSIIKTIAIPNDIQDWPTTALNGCTNLEKISVYGEEAQTGEISITRDYGLYDFAHLTSVQLPSSVTSIGDAALIMSNPVFPKGLKEIRLSPRLTVIQISTFYETSLVSIDFRRCIHLQSINHHAFRGASQLSPLDLSACQSLTSLGNATFFFCHSLTCITFPPSLTRIEPHAFRTSTAADAGSGTLPSPVKTIIWKGRTTRPAIDDNTGIHTSAFVLNSSLESLVASGAITEIFVP